MICCCCCCCDVTELHERSQFSRQGFSSLSATHPPFVIRDLPNNNSRSNNNNDDVAKQFFETRFEKKYLQLWFFRMHFFLAKITTRNNKDVHKWRQSLRSCLLPCHVFIPRRHLYFYIIKFSSSLVKAWRHLWATLNPTLGLNFLWCETKTKNNLFWNIQKFQQIFKGLNYLPKSLFLCKLNIFTISILWGHQF